jgi:MYXO-CTERM domain-containing protein
VEVCDTIDNDCDGDADEDIPGEATECGVGACTALGALVCLAGELVDTCRPRPQSTEICDRLDNDCDGEVDDGLEPRESECGVGACAATGEWRCVDGVTSDDCSPAAPSDELCDAIDNDCDGETDEGGVCDAPPDEGVSTPRDAGAPDEGAPGPDQGREEDATPSPDGTTTPAVNATGDGGCSCGPGEERGDPTLWALLVLGAVLRRRRED